MVELHLLQELGGVTEVTVELLWGTDECGPVEAIQRVERALKRGSEVRDLVEGVEVWRDVRVAAGEAKHGQEDSQHWPDEHPNL